MTVGWSVVWLPLLPIVFTVFETTGWWFAFARQGCPLPFVTLYRFTVAVKTIQGVTPSLSQAGELAKLHLLRRAGVEPGLATASLVTAKTTIVAAELAFLVFGFTASVGFFSVDPALQTWTVVGIVVLAVALAGVLIWQWLGVFQPVVRLGRRLPLLRAFFERHEALLLSTDTILKEYLVQHRARFWGSTLAFFVFWLVGVVDVWLILWMLGLPVTASAGLFIHVWLMVVSRLTAFVPAHLGTLEAGALMVFALVGLPAEAALAFSLLRRFRQLMWIAAGLAVWPATRRGPATVATIRTSSGVRS